MAATGNSSEGQEPKLDANAERFTFFYGRNSIFSQFHRCSFKGSSLFVRDGVEHRFSCAEQWMMFNKAQLFKDHEIAGKIINAAQSPPSYYKRLGRQVKNFNEETWKKHNYQIIYEGNKLKFTQNPRFMDQLISTEGTTLVEASPSDKIYGIGLRSNDPLASNRKTWNGTNLLGEILTALRNDLMGSSIAR